MCGAVRLEYTIAMAPQLNDIPNIVSDRMRFDAVLYTPLREAQEELDRRRCDAHLNAAVQEFLNGNVLEPLRDTPRAVIARSVVSPNYETRRFADVVYGHKKLEPLFLEYRHDKFATNNEAKRMMGRLYFYHGKGRSGDMRTHSLNVVNFSESNGERISAVKTLWGQNFVDFHHEYFDTKYQRLSHTFFDASDWLHEHGAHAAEYYRAFLALFIRHGILFENLLLDEKERAFTTQIFLPSFISLHQTFGLKPLIVPLTPTDVEEHPFWLCYPSSDKDYVTELTRRVA